MFNYHLKRSSFLSTALCVLLLMLYVIGSTKLNAFHDFFHHHESVVHDERAEADACHRAIFHHDIQAGCGHDAHFTESIDCDWQDEILSSHHYPDFSFDVSQPQVVSSPIRSSDQNFSFELHLLLSARGPPLQS